MRSPSSAEETASRLSFKREALPATRCPVAETKLASSSR
jgi:hypothetical protein